MHYGVFTASHRAMGIVLGKRSNGICCDGRIAVAPRRLLGRIMGIGNRGLGGLVLRVATGKERLLC